MLYFVADRLALAPDQAAKQAVTILATLALGTILASPLGGWLADRIGRLPRMIAGALLGAASSVLLIGAHSAAILTAATWRSWHGARATPSAGPSPTTAACMPPSTAWMSEACATWSM